jgi:hypothetical protein
MVNKWKNGQLYAFNNAVVLKLTYSPDWEKSYFNNFKDTFVLLERPRSEHVPKGLPSRPWGNWAKILTTKGEMYWVRLERFECSIVTKKWLRNHPEMV